MNADELAFLRRRIEPQIMMIAARALKAEEGWRWAWRERIGGSRSARIAAVAAYAWIVLNDEGRQRARIALGYQAYPGSVRRAVRMVINAMHTDRVQQRTRRGIAAKRRLGERVADWSSAASLIFLPPDSDLLFADWGRRHQPARPTPEPAAPAPRIN